MKKHEQAISEDRNQRLRLESAVNGIIEDSKYTIQQNIIVSCQELLTSFMISRRESAALKTPARRTRVLLVS